MTKKASITQKLQEILTSEAYDQLEPFKNTKGWEPMSADDKELLAQLFITLGKRQLNSDDPKAQDTFALAEQATPKSAPIFTEIGNAYASHTLSSKSLYVACQSFERATQLKPMYAPAWLGWARALRYLGDLEDEPTHHNIAHTYLEKVATLIKDEPTATQAEFHHEWGQLWATQGTLSGEASDFHKALECYRKAESYGLHTAEFYNDYANTLRHLTKLLDRPDLLSQALILYKKALKQDKRDLDTLHNLIDILCVLYPQTMSQQHYTDALHHFESLSILNENGPDFWLLWGSLLAFNGKFHGDMEAVESSLSKLECSFNLDSSNPVTLVRWAESLRLLGSHHEDIDKLKAAEVKVAQALHLNPKHIEGWYLYGIILCEMGRYFGEQAYYLEALDKFRCGLNQDQQNAMLWYGLAQVYLSLGDLTGDRSFHQKANAAFNRAFEFGIGPSPQFWNSWGVTLMKVAEMNDQETLVEEAIEKFERAIAVSERVDPEWLYNYGCAYDFLGDLTGEPEHYEKAIQLLLKVLEIDADYLPAIYNIALAFSHLGEAVPDTDCLYRACEYFQQLLQKEPEDDYAWNDWGTTLVHLALILHDPSLPERSQQLFAQSEEKFLQAVRLGCSSALYNLACIHSLNSNLELAMHYIQKADEQGSLPPVDDILQDEWLHNLRQTSEFRGFLTTLANRKRHI